MREKLKCWLENDLVFFICLVVLISIGAFALGRYSVLKIPSGGGGVASVAMSYTTQGSTSPTVPLDALAPDKADTAAPALPASSMEVVASKKGTKYHLPTCPGALQIKSENKIVFPSEQAAKAAGLERAANCKMFPELLP